jgi:restriction system protein
MSFASRPVRYRHDDALTRVSWDEFERRVADHYRRQGYVVEHTGTLSREHRKSGIDLTLRSGLESILVKCMHWPAQQVPHDHVHQLIAAISSEGATGAIVVTSGEFTQAAIETGAKFRHIKLIDGMAVRAMFGQVVEPETNWALVGQDTAGEATEEKTPQASRAPVIAAVSAVLVMGVLLLALYTFYVREIHQAQMDAVRDGVPPANSSVRMKAGPLARPGDIGEPVAEWRAPQR